MRNDTLDQSLRKPRWHYASMLYLLGWGKHERDKHESTITFAHYLGFNAVRFNIWWHEIYPNAEAVRRGGNWEPLDETIRMATDLGLKVILTVSMRPLFSNMFFFGDEDRVRNIHGVVDTNWDGTTRISYGSPKIAYGVDFFRQFGERYRDHQNAGHILCISPLITRDAEIPYAHEEHEDMCQAFVDEYRRWYEDKHSSSSAAEPSVDFASEAGRDWYLFRDLKARQFIDSCCDVLEKVPGLDIPYRVLLDYGNLGDPMAVKRGSISFPFHTQHPRVWGIKHNDAHDYDQRYTGSILGSHARRAGLMAFNEWFYHKEAKHYPSGDIVKDSVREITGHFNQGMNGVSYCGVMRSNEKDIEAVVKTLQDRGEWDAPVKARWADAPYVREKLSNLIPLEGWGIRQCLFDSHIGTGNQVDIEVECDLKAPLLPLIKPLPIVV